MSPQKLGQYPAVLKSGVGELIQGFDPSGLSHLEKLNVIHGAYRRCSTHAHRTWILPQRLHYLIQILIGGVGRHSEAAVVGDQLGDGRGILMIAQRSAAVQMDQADRRRENGQRIVRTNMLIQIIQRESSAISGPVCDR